MLQPQEKESYIPKPVAEYFPEDIEEVHKDKKTMNILFNGLDKDLFDNVINCTTSKEVWDTIQTLCEGTEQVRENEMQLLIQQYEHFYFKSGENMSDTFNRFQKLLNGLKLYGKVYQVKDSNLKFIRALPREWKPITMSMRNTQEYREYSLERLYGILKTYELEMEQDDEIEKIQRKGGSATLMASVKEVQSEDEETPTKAAPNPRVCEGRTEPNKGKGVMTEEPDEEDANDDSDVDEHLAFLSRKFSKLRFKRNYSASKPFKKNFQPNKNMVDKSKFKCYNCGVAGHFSNECRKPKAINKYESVDYKKKYFDLLKQKEKAFITKEKDWADDDDSDEEKEYVDLALMAVGDEDDQEASSASNQVISTNISELSKDECNSTINEMSTELYHLHITLKSLTVENTRIKQSNVLLSERNGVVETQLLEFEKMKRDC